MRANELLSLFVQASFIILGGVSIADYLRQRDRIRRDIALMFGSLALPFLIQFIERLMGIQVRWLNTIGLMSLISQPYLLLRLGRYFQPIPTRLMQLAFIGMIVSWAAFVLAGLFLPLWAAIALLAIITYFVTLNGYTMLIFVRGALTTAGVVRQRLRFAATGSGLLALALFGVALVVLFPAWREGLTSITLFMAIVSALAYYVGFASPRWLRRVWQLTELHHFLSRTSARPLAERVNAEETFRYLCQGANRAMSNVGAVVVQQDGMERCWKLRYPPDFAPLSTLKMENLSSFEQAWQDRQPLAIQRSSASSEPEQGLLERVRASTLLVVPIATAERTWAMLLVFLRYGSLFMDDDLGLLGLFAQQSALVLENDALVEDLQNNNAQLDAANHELEAFSYSVSHDLRAPLRAVNGFARILLDDYSVELSPDPQRYLRLIRDNARQMGQLIDDLLTFSRLTRQPLHRENVNMAALAQQVFEQLHNGQDQQPIDLVMGELPTCEADPALIKQVWLNLLSNALKYSSKCDAARVEVGCQERDDRQVFFVRDNGVGFDMRYADKLFGVFQRLHRAEDYEGTGVGLAVVQRIIHRHGGTIWAEAEVNRGATFYFTLQPGGIAR